MKRWLSYLIGMAMFAVLGMGTAAAQTQSRRGTVVVPQSNVELPENIGKSAHTNFLIFVPAQRGAKPYLGGTSPGGETPSSLACVYQIGASNSSNFPGCPVDYNSNTMNYDNPSGGSNVIAIVDAYDYPTACSDFNTFSTEFALPAADCTNQKDPHFRVVYASGSQPRSNCGWAQEAALDIEWAHAMAPKAQIILVEAASNKNNDLLQAVQVASNEVVCGESSCSAGSSGAGQVSMSWGSSEFSSELTYDSYFSTPGVTYFASSGDSGGKVIWPSASANVISAGGTSVNRASDGSFQSESAWSSAGGGPSQYVLMPDYQGVIQNFAKILNGYRGTPDFSFDADPYTGVSVYDSTSCQGMSGWLVFGGTSVASPSLAGIFNLAGAFSGGWDGGLNTSSAQNKLYQSFATVTNDGTTCNYTSELYDVVNGSAGSYPATACWDFASGIGTDRGDSALAGSTSSSGSLSLSASPSSATVTEGQGGSWTPTITATSSASTGTVDLTASCSSSTSSDCTASGVTANLTSSSITLSSGAGSTTMNVTTTNTTPAGTYTIIVMGTSGSLSSSTTFTVTVAASSSGADFSISASPSSLTISPKGSASYTISVGSVSGFSGSVTLSVSESIPQSRATISPDPVTVTSGGPATSTLTVGTGPKTTSGLYTISITGTSGSLTHSTSVSLTVQ